MQPHERRSSLIPALCLGLNILLLAACSAPPDANTAKPAAQTAAPPPDSIIINANIVTLAAAPAAATVQAMAITGGKISALGTTAHIQSLAGPNTTSYTPPAGATLLPGFIDPHSHMGGVGFYSDTKHWWDVSSVNLLFKPDPGEPGCTNPNDPQTCFIPVQSQDDVIARLKYAVTQVDPNSPTPYVMAFNYDPSRLGKSADCAAGNLAFQCVNFENGQALAQLNAVSTTVPILVASESGHIAYVNSPALALLDICNIPGASSKCYAPTTNSTVETALAVQGQLDEDLALYAIGWFQGKVLEHNPGLGAQLLQAAATIYASHGYTLAQEGAANESLMAMYLLALDSSAKQAKFPLSVALIAYDAASADFNKTISAANRARKAFADQKNPLVTVAAVKTFADGSTQGYTAWMNEPYLTLFPPFNDTALFPQQPYEGLPDVTQADMTSRLSTAHAAGYPMLIHQNGDAATAAALAALNAAKPPPKGMRDVVIHAPMINAAQLASINAEQVAISFLMPNVYFYGLPECQQVLGPENSLNMYPVAAAAARGLTYTLHTDSPVTPPAPLFAMWVAATRQSQQPSWYPNTNPAACPQVMASTSGLGNQAISIADALKAYTVNAAWQYGMEDSRGTLEVGKYADIVMLSANPLQMQATPDQLSQIQIIGTYSLGRQFINPLPASNWPD